MKKSNKLNSPHDKLFKATFSNTDVALPFLKAKLSRSLLGKIDLSTLQLEKTSFIDDQLKEFHADVLYKVSDRQGEGYICFLLEHQSTPDKTMVIRLLEYMTRVWRYHIDKNKAERLPIIYPIVLYTGKKPYCYARSLAEGFQHPEWLSSMLKRPFLVDLPRQSRQLTLKDGRAALFELFLGSNDLYTLLEDAYIQDSLAKESAFYIPIFLYTLATDNHPVEAIKEKFINLNPSKKRSIMSALERIEQRGIKLGEQRGIKLGEQRGIKLGEQRGKKAIAHNLLEMKMSRKKIADILEMDIENLNKLLKSK